MKKIIYHLQNVRKDYSDRSVLQVEELDIYQGEVFALVGPSGAGKSPLLRLLNFLESPTQGTIHFEKSEFSATRDMPVDIRRKVTTVFQNPMLLNRSVWANVHYGLKLRGLRDSSARIQAALDNVGMLEFAEKRARFLSGGEAQRVALARAIVLQPEVLLLDEPTANLDPYNIGVIEETVAELNRLQGTTVVLVTHNIFQARRMAQRVALLLDGGVVEIAGVDEFFSSPRDPRTAAFVRGEMVY
ncbi:MAG: phosphate ABC transporter ATP-binding protein [Anaerolineales bacterium]|nr:phosphate ABC transporter ATP-binding protein [Anaerolineales bacterium]